MIIPKKLLITVNMGMETALGKKILASRYELDAGNHIYLVIYLLLDGEKGNSFFKPYYDILPIMLDGIPIFWNKDELRYLNGSYLLNQIEEKKREIEKDYNILCRIDPSFSRFSLDKFSWARMIVTRYFLR